MRRRALAVLGAAAALGACDSGDGRELRPPTESERAAVPTTTTTTQPLASLPLDVITSTSVGAAGTVAPTPSIAAAVTTEPGAFGLQAPWVTGGTIDASYTCDGAGLMPTLSWTAPPTGAVELALLVSDDDAQAFVHWAVAGIAATAGQVGEGVPISGREGTNGFGASGWDGPCPASPGETHTYRFALYALGQPTQLPEGFSGADLSAAALATAVGYAETTGSYTRAG